MIRRLASLALILGAVAPAAAQIPEKPIPLRIHAATSPAPALQYQLLPRVEDRSPGNRAQLYYRSFSPEWEGWRRREGLLDQIDRALQAPLKELPRKELSWIMDYAQLREVDRAARREYVDWELTPRLQSEGVHLLLPDVQGFRGTANLLALRARFEIADQHYDKAVYTLQTGYGLARDVSDAPLLINTLVGVAIAMTMSNQVEELIQAPGSPNLYWALTSLPSPMTSLHKPLQGERMLVYAELPELRHIQRQLSAEQQRRLQDEVLRVMAMESERPRGVNWESRLELTALVAKQYAVAKQALIARGWKAQDVDALSALQVVMMQSLDQFQRLEDDYFKWFAFPYWQALPEIAKADQRIVAAKARLEAEPLLPFLPNVTKVYSTTARLDRRIAALRCIEAIRLYAATHDGKLPAALGNITEVPIPLDPMSGHAFQYKLDGNKASLSAPPPPGEPSLPQDALAYELILER